MGVGGEIFELELSDLHWQIAPEPPGVLNSMCTLPWPFGATQEREGQELCARLSVAVDEALNGCRLLNSQK